MNEANLTVEQLLLVANAAAEMGAKVALDRIEQERQQDRKEMADRRLRNTKLLLRNYRLFKAHVANAVYEFGGEDDTESPLAILEDLMMPGRDNTLFVESIQKSASRTSIIVEHIDTMLKIYRAFCDTSGAEDDMRRWRVIDGLYISEPRQTIHDLAVSEGVVERTIYKDIDAACEKIAALMFGIDGIRKR